MKLLGMEELNKNIKQDLSEYIHNVDKLRNLVRYQTAARVSSETVAEHSFFVAAYVLKLHDYYDFDLEKALKMAILHDFSEVFISDVPHPIKRAHPEIAEALEKVETEINSEYIGEDFAKDLDGFNHLTTAEGCAVALADILSVVSYSKYEIGLGNSKYMKKVLDGAKYRYIKVLDRAQEYEREGVTMSMILNLLEDFVN